MGTDRLKPLDVSFLYFDSRVTPMHAVGILTFDPPGDDRPVLSFEDIVAFVEPRIADVPRLRQKVKWVPGQVASPVWVDDTRFDLGFHLRRTVLPAPGSLEQLLGLAAQLMETPLDGQRPLWELHVVEGAEPGGFAVIVKIHHALVDGIAAVNALGVLLDVAPDPPSRRPAPWEPRPEPGAVRLVTEGAGDWLRRPVPAAGSLDPRNVDVKAATSAVAGVATGLASALGALAAPPRGSLLNQPTGAHRRIAVSSVTLADLKAVASAFGGTVNDVVLAVCTNALRGWLEGSGEQISSDTTLRAMVPVSIREAATGVDGNFVASYFIELPVGEPDPLAQLRRVSREMRAHKGAKQQIGAQALTRLAGFVPPALHALGARLTISATNRLFNLVVTNVPGPQYPLYMAGARLAAFYPVVPLTGATNLAVGVTSYNGRVFFGLNSDSDALQDVSGLADRIESSLAMLLEHVDAG